MLYFSHESLLKVVLHREILHRDFSQAPGNYYLSLTIAKIERLEKFHRLKNKSILKALTVKLSIFKNKRTSHPEISTEFYKNLPVRLMKYKLLQSFALDARMVKTWHLTLSGIGGSLRKVHHSYFNCQFLYPAKKQVKSMMGIQISGLRKR